MIPTTVLVTRPDNRAEPLKSRLEKFGAEVLSQPTIAIRSPLSWDEADRALERIADFDWLVFSSVNGVEFFFSRLSQLLPEQSIRSRIALVGPGTNDALRRRIGREADLMPEIYTAEGLLKTLDSEARLGKRFLIPRGSRGRNLLPATLKGLGGSVTEVSVYQSIDVGQARPEILDLMRQGKIDWTTVTSSAIARSLVRLFGSRLQHTRLASISPITSQTLRELGFPPAAEAGEASIDGMAELLKKFIENL